MRPAVNNLQRRRLIALILAFLIPLNFIVGAVAVAADAFSWSRDQGTARRQGHWLDDQPHAHGTRGGIAAA